MRMVVVTMRAVAVSAVALSSMAMGGGMGVRFSHVGRPRSNRFAAQSCAAASRVGASASANFFFASSTHLAKSSCDTTLTMIGM